MQACKNITLFLEGRLITGSPAPRAPCVPRGSLFHLVVLWLVSLQFKDFSSVDWVYYSVTVKLDCPSSPGSCLLLEVCLSPGIHFSPAWPPQPGGLFYQIGGLDLWLVLALEPCEILETSGP